MISVITTVDIAIPNNQVWSNERESINIPLNLSGFHIERVNFPNNCYSLDITASEAVKRFLNALHLISLQNLRPALRGFLGRPAGKFN